jgi:hypothetical protein
VRFAIQLTPRNQEDIGGADLGGGGRLCQVLSGVVDLTFTHNTGLAAHSFLFLDGAPMVRLVYTDNIVADGESGLIGSDSSDGSTSLNTYAPGAVFSGNVILATDDLASRYLAGNYFARP